MELHQRRILLSNNDNSFRIYFMGDFHLGHINFDRDKLERHIELIKKDSKAFVFIMGDLIDARCPDNKYFDYEQRDHHNKDIGFIKDCYSQVEKYLKPISSNIIGIHEGNHDRELHKHEYPYVKELCEKLNVKFLGYRAITNVKTYREKKNAGGGARSWNIFTTHGSGSGRRTGAKINRIEDEFNSTEADVYAQGHTHTLSISHTIRQYLDTHNGPLNLMEQDYFYLNTGSYMKSYQKGNYSYSEKSSYRPQKTGCMMLEFLPKHNKINGGQIT